jgi:hypothetical protein
MPSDTKWQQSWLLVIGLYCLEGSTRGLLMAIVPLSLLAQFGTVQHVTYFYIGSAIVGLGNSVLVPWLTGKIGSKGVLALSGSLTAVTAAMIASDTVLGVGIGLIGRPLALACMDIPLLAVIMTVVPRRSLGSFEPYRIFAQGACITIAPWIGYRLFELAAWLPFAASFAGGVLFVLVSRYVPAPVGGERPPSIRGAASLARFFEQKRLVAAWLLAVIRSSFWQALFIYASIFAVSCGWSSSAAATLLSFAMATLVFVPLWGRLGRAFGARPVLVIAYGFGAIFLVAASVTGLTAPFIAPLFLLAAAFFASVIDGVGNVLFLRASRSFERAAMAGVYSTYRDVAQFLTVVLFALILWFVALPVALLTIAAAFLFASWLASLVHPRIR